MEKYVQFDVFSYGIYTTDLTTDSFSNRAKRLGDDFSFDLDDFASMLENRGMVVDNQELKSIAKVVLKDKCCSWITTDEYGYDIQWVIIMKVVRG